MTDINKKIINMINYVSEDEKKAIFKLLDVSRADVVTNMNAKLILAIFRDVYMFKEMSQAYILNQKQKIQELEDRINELEKRC
jgi:hypothetical protein